MSDPVRYEIDGPRVTLTLARPQARNALDDRTLELLLAHLQAAADAPSARVVVLAAEGGTFCAGADLSAAVTGDEASFAGAAARRLGAVVTAVTDHRLPVVARVQGPAVGGGNALVAAADLAVAADESWFAFREVRLGVVPAVVSIPVVSRVGAGAASDLFLTGRRVPADEACRLGLVHRVVAAEDLDDAVTAVVSDLLLAAPSALAATKRLVADARAGRLSLADAADRSSAAFASDDGREGMTAFLERRPPRWAP